jgi:hypothetical protein
MKYEETFTAPKQDVLDLVKKVVPDTFVRNLRDGGVKFEVPRDRDLEMKVKYDVEEEKGSVLIKIGWSNIDEEEEEEEEKDED